MSRGTGQMVHRGGNKRKQLSWGVETGVLREEISEEATLK